jgi:hypothetical protein
MIERANAERHDMQTLLDKSRERLEIELRELQQAEIDAIKLPDLEQRALALDSLQMRLAKFRLDLIGLKDAEATLEA